jgi:ABC-2 type transport system ATP-binding protein
MTEIEPVLYCADLTKRFGDVQALDGITLRLPPGCTGLLGPNGAGKSTLIRLLLGLLPPDQGSAAVLGYDPSTQPLPLRRLVGYMPEHDCLPSDWLAQDFVRYMAQLHGLPAREAIQRASDALYHVGLGEERYRALGGFSTGMKQRVKLAQALVHDPSLLFLDEPTNGLDPGGREEMLALIRRIAREMGLNILLSSHLLGDVEAVADVVVILNAGRVIVQGPLGELIGATPTVEVQVEDGAEECATVIRRCGYEVQVDGGSLYVDYTDEDVFDAIRDALVHCGATLRFLQRHRRSLQDVYLASQRPTTNDVAAMAGRR